MDKERNIVSGVSFGSENPEGFYRLKIKA